MKKFIATVLSSMILLSITISSAFATESYNMSSNVDEQTNMSYEESLSSVISNEEKGFSNPYELDSTYMDESVEITVLDQGTFETIDGSLSSASNQRKYHFTADFSNTSEYCLGFIRTGRGGFTVTVSDIEGTKVDSKFCNGPGPVQDVGGQILLKKPSSTTKEYTYTVTISTSAFSFVEDDTTFRLAFGVSSEKQYFFEGQSNCMYLPYFHRYRNTSQDIASYRQTNSIGNTGFYYKIDAIGQEVVTLASNNGQHFFRILDASNNALIYDSARIGSWQIEGFPSYYTVVPIDFVAGKSYYVVVYDNGSTNYEGAYTITVGDYRTTGKTICYTVPEQTVVKGQSYEFTFDVPDHPKGGRTYASRLNYYLNRAGWGTGFDVLSPGTSKWRNFGVGGLDLGYENPEAPLVNATGTWTFRFTPTRSGTYPGGDLELYYFYDIM